MGFVSWVVVGTLAGVFARRAVPGPDPGRLVVTLIVGVAGACLGGFVVGVLGGSGATSFDIWSLLVATLGALASLHLYGMAVRRTA